MISIEEMRTRLTSLGLSPVSADTEGEQGDKGAFGVETWLRFAPHTVIGIPVRGESESDSSFENRMAIVEKLIVQAEHEASGGGQSLASTPATHPAYPPAPTPPSFLTKETASEPGVVSPSSPLIDFAADTSDAIHEDVEAASSAAGTAQPVAQPSAVPTPHSAPQLASVPLPPALPTASDADFVAPFAAHHSVVPSAPLSSVPSIPSPQNNGAAVPESVRIEFTELRRQFAEGIARIDAILAAAEGTHKE